MKRGNLNTNLLGEVVISGRLTIRDSGKVLISRKSLIMTVSYLTLTPYSPTTSAFPCIWPSFRFLSPYSFSSAIRRPRPRPNGSSARHVSPLMRSFPGQNYAASAHIFWLVSVSKLHQFQRSCDLPTIEVETPRMHVRSIECTMAVHYWIICGMNQPLKG